MTTNAHDRFEEMVRKSKLGLHGSDVVGQTFTFQCVDGSVPYILVGIVTGLEYQEQTEGKGALALSVSTPLLGRYALQCFLFVLGAEWDAIVRNAFGHEQPKLLRGTLRINYE